MPSKHVPKFGKVFANVDPEAVEVIIRGGCLAPKTAWVVQSSKLTWEGNKAFMHFKKNDQDMAKLCGKSLQGSRFVDMLQDARNAEVGTILQSLVAKHDAHQIPLQSMARMKEFRKQVAAGAPATCTASLSTSESTVALTFLFETDMKKCASVMVNTQSMDFITNGLRLEPCTPSEKKRKSSEFKHREVHMSHKRDSAFVRYRDAEGRWHQRNKKIGVDRDAPLEVRHAALRDVGDELYDFFVSNNVHAEGGDEDAEEDDDDNVEAESADDVDDAAHDIERESAEGEAADIPEDGNTREGSATAPSESDGAEEDDELARECGLAS